MEPPVSLPSAAGTSPLLTTADEPPELPPGVRERSKGFTVCSKKLVSVVLPMANSSQLVLPITTAPAAFSRSTQGASNEGT